MLAREKSQKIVLIKTRARACTDCGLEAFCLAGGLQDQELEQLAAIVKRRITLGRGEHLYRMGGKFRSVFAVRTGSLKTYTLSENGAEQITGFHFPSELVGLDAITKRFHPSAVQALETTTLCELPYDRLEALVQLRASVRQQFIRLMSKEVLANSEHITLLGKKDAKARLATLLLRFARRFEQRGFSAREFHLSMSRSDIGNHLGLSTETVSRLFTGFQRLGLILVDRKLVKIHDHDALLVFSGDAPGQSEARQSQG